jgi:hypothetical protein
MSWHRWSALCLLACIYLAAAVHRDGHAGPETGLIPITVFLNAWWVTEPISFERR